MTDEEWTALMRDATEGKLRILQPQAGPGAPRLRIQLTGGPQDGGTYACPTVYPGLRGLPDALMLWAGARATLYVRADRAGIDYRYVRADDEKELIHAAQ